MSTTSNNPDILYKSYAIYSPYTKNKLVDGTIINMDDLLSSLNIEIKEFIKSTATADAIEKICTSFNLPIEDVFDVVTIVRDIACGIRGAEALKDLPDSISLDPEESAKLISELVGVILMPIRKYIKPANLGALASGRAKNDNDEEMAGSVIDLRNKK